MRIKTSFTLAMLAMTILLVFARYLRAATDEPDSISISDVYFVGTFPAMAEDGSLPFTDAKSTKNTLGKLTVADQGMAFWSMIIKDYKRYALRQKFMVGTGIESTFFRDATILGISDHGTYYFFYRETGFQRQEKERISQLFVRTAVSGKNKN